MIKHFQEVTKDDFNMIGGKGINLGLMLQAGFPVPAGFCVLTTAFDAYLKDSDMREWLLKLDVLDPEDLSGIEAAGRRMREGLLSHSMDEAMRAAVSTALEAYEQNVSEEGVSFAVRSSATAEDLPDASFAGQQDSFLFVQGMENVIDAIRKCWASLFNDRAISYRLKNGISSNDLSISVVVQRMVDPEVSGVVFTADPLTEHRDHMALEYVSGTGEDLVGGKRIPNEVLFDRKKRTVLTHSQAADANGKISDATILRLAGLTEKIEDLYGTPMDVEWALDKAGKLWILQARAITTLLPLIQPERSGNAFYFSFHHVQNMMDPIRPLGASCMQLILPFDRDGDGKTQIFQYVGGYLFVDMTDYFAVPLFRKTLGMRFDMIDAVMAGSFRCLFKDAEFVRGIEPRSPKGKDLLRAARFMLHALRLASKPKNLKIEDCNVFIDDYVQTLKREIARADSLETKLAVCREGIAGYLMEAFTRIVPFIGPGMGSYRFLVKRTEKAFGSDELAQTLAKGVRGNATTEMGLCIGDLAERIREEQNWHTRLNQWDPGVFVSELMREESPAGDQMRLVMERYGARGIGEIDITNHRWFEDPSAIVLSVRNHLRVYKPGQHRAEFDAMTQASQAAGERIVECFGSGWNRWKRRFYRNMVDRVLYLMPAREHGKYGMVLVMGEAKKVILEAGQLAVERGWLNRTEDCYYLEFDEIVQMVSEGCDRKALVKERRHAFEKAGFHRVPRVVTDRGWIVPPEETDRELKENELAGAGVSSGVYEGIARVVQRPEQARLEPGEILIAPFTDPGWTPLFIHAKGLVLEVGGLMTHGAIVAREYGIPAVVGVDRAMERVKSGDRLRVDGNSGIVTILESETEDEHRDDKTII